MSNDKVVQLDDRALFTDALTSLLQQGARQLIMQGVEAELGEFMKPFKDRQTQDGLAAVVRNGYQPERQIPKVRAKDGTPVTFRSALVPPYVRKAKSLEAALPWLYLKGISTGEMAAALEVLVGPDAKGLSASTVARLKQQWGEAYKDGCQRSLASDQWVYLWADGIDSRLRASDTKLCALVVIGVNERGEKHLLAIDDGIRESTQSWREVLLDLKARGMNSARLAMGFWAALDEVYPKTQQQRCWLHKTMNVLNCVPKSVQPKMKQALHNIWQAETKDKAENAFDTFIRVYNPKYPKAALCLHKDRDELLAFYDFPAHHWQSIRTTHSIASTFGTIRHRTKRSKGCLTRDGMLPMMFKLGQCAQKKWHRLRGFDYLAKVITGVKFKDGIEATELNRSAA